MRQPRYPNSLSQSSNRSHTNPTVKIDSNAKTGRPGSSISSRSNVTNSQSRPRDSLAELKIKGNSTNRVKSVKPVDVVDLAGVEDSSGDESVIIEKSERISQGIDKPLGPSELLIQHSIKNCVHPLAMEKMTIFPDLEDSCKKHSQSLERTRSGVKVLKDISSAIECDAVYDGEDRFSANAISPLRMSIDHESSFWFREYAPTVQSDGPESHAIGAAKELKFPFKEITSLR